MAPPILLKTPPSGFTARMAARTMAWDKPTCGMAPGYLQANLIVLPQSYADDFELLCTRNPVPCPLLAKSSQPGYPHGFRSCIPGVLHTQIAGHTDIRTDAPRYNVYVDGVLREEKIPDVKDWWKEDHVAFLVGCSYSFESALAKAGLTPPHVLHGRNVAMYRTNIPLCPAGKFQGGMYVVSMRMYRKSEVVMVRDITRPYVTTHGEPVEWGWNGARKLGIEDVAVVQWGDSPVTKEGKAVVQEEEEKEEDGYVPVFWGCGVTPQEAVMKAKVPGVVIGHAPGYMVVLDVKEEDVLPKLA